MAQEPAWWFPRTCKGSCLTFAIIICALTLMYQKNEARGVSDKEETVV
jgi:hypothetical protein